MPKTHAATQNVQTFGGRHRQQFGATKPIDSKHWHASCSPMRHLHQLGGNLMRRIQQLTRLLIATTLLLAGFSGSILARSQDEKGQRDSPTSMTGCLSKDSSGNYALTDEKDVLQKTVESPNCAGLRTRVNLLSPSIQASH
jgi:hypothetical protein